MGASVIRAPAGGLGTGSGGPCAGGCVVRTGRWSVPRRAEVRASVARVLAGVRYTQVGGPHPGRQLRAGFGGSCAGGCAVRKGRWFVARRVVGVRASVVGVLTGGFCGPCADGRFGGGLRYLCGGGGAVRTGRWSAPRWAVGGGFGGPCAGGCSGCELRWSVSRRAASVACVSAGGLGAGSVVGAGRARGVGRLGVGFGGRSPEWRLLWFVCRRAVRMDAAMGPASSGGRCMSSLHLRPVGHPEVRFGEC